MTKQLELLVDEELPKKRKDRANNERYELALSIAERMGNTSQSNIKRILKEINTVVENGLDLDLAVMCWEWLRETGAPRGDDKRWKIDQARLTTVLTGSPAYYQQFTQDIFDNIPPVWDSNSHDNYVRLWSKALSKVGFVYRGGRMQSEEIESLGLTNRGSS